MRVLDIGVWRELWPDLLYGGNLTGNWRQLYFCRAAQSISRYVTASCISGTSALTQTTVLLRWWFLVEAKGAIQAVPY